MPLVCLFVTGGLVFAQAELANFVQEGMATWQVTGGGLQAAHPSLPIGSTPTIRNVATGKEIAVTITGRIPVSTERIIDISSDAARAIGLVPGGAVMVYFPPPAVVTVPPLESHTGAQGINITIHNHVIPHSAWAGRRPSEASYAPAPVSAFLPPTPPPFPRVIPNLPYANSGRIYRLRVGSWPYLNNAFVAFLQLREADFSTVHEYNDGMYSVYASGIVSHEVFSVVQQLGDMGFMEIHIWEQ